MSITLYGTEHDICFNFSIYMYIQLIVGNKTYIHAQVILYEIGKIENVRM